MSPNKYPNLERHRHLSWDSGYELQLPTLSDFSNECVVVLVTLAVETPLSNHSDKQRINNINNNNNNNSKTVVNSKTHSLNAFFFCPII